MMISRVVLITMVVLVSMPTLAAGDTAGKKPGGSARQNSANEEASTFEVEASSDAMIALTLPLPDNGEVLLRVIRGGGEPGSAFVASVSGLRDGTGAPLEGNLSIGEKQGTAGVLSDLTAPNGVASLLLKIKPVPDAGQVTGVFTIVARTSKSWRLNLDRGGKPTATLVVDTPIISRELVCDWWHGCTGEQGRATVRFWEKQHAWPLTDVGLRMEQVSKAGVNFDPHVNVMTTLNNLGLDLWSVTSKDDPNRRIASNGQGLVEFHLRNISPGEYNATLRFQAANSVADDAQKVTLVLTVKHHILWATAVLIGGLLVSLLGTKMLNVLRKRLDINSRATTLSESWLKQEPATSVVVWTLANLKLVRCAARASWWSMPEDLDARLDKVTAMLPTLRSIREARQEIGTAITPPFVTQRAEGVLEGIVRNCSDPPLGATKLAAADEQLKILGSWVAGDWQKPYWENLKPSICSLLADVRPDEIGDRTANNALQSLVDGLKPYCSAGTAVPTTNPVELERKYDGLRLLWNHRSTPYFSDLVEKYTSGTLEQAFELVDKKTWHQLREAVGKQQVEIEVPSSAPQQYEPFTLAVKPKDGRIAQSFLLRHKLRYEWHIERAHPRVWQRTFNLPSPHTLQPTITQYWPHAEELKTSVSIRSPFDDEPKSLEILGPNVKVSPSESLGLFKAFSGLDLLSTALVGGVAVLTGISTFYTSSATFGATKDYVALALWALAFDQAKTGIVQIAAATKTGDEEAKKGTG